MPSAPAIGWPGAVSSTAWASPRLRCVSGENWRIDSMSSPKNSIRYGASASGE